MFLAFAFFLFILFCFCFLRSCSFVVALFLKKTPKIFSLLLLFLPSFKCVCFLFIKKRPKIFFFLLASLTFGFLCSSLFYLCFFYFCLLFYKTENKKYLSFCFCALPLTFENAKIFSLLLFIAQLFAEFSSCPGRHLHYVISFISFGCACDKAIMTIFDEVDVTGKLV